MVKRKNILLCCTGSVATIKAINIIQLLRTLDDIEIKMVFTEHATHFCDPKAVIDAGVELFRDEDEWTAWQQRGDPVLHIELGKWADVLLIAPLDANTLAKLAQGLCDNLLTSTVRAWDLSKPLLFCPAMNTRMWDHPLTASQILQLKSLGYIEIPCIAKTLMCKDVGMGAMAEPETIVEITKTYLL